jgi:hypothetical protein
MTVMKRSAFIWLLFVRLSLSISHGPSAVGCMLLLGGGLTVSICQQ